MSNAAHAYRRLASVWNKIKGDVLELEDLLELRARSRAFAFSCPANCAAARSIDLEDWAQLLYADPQAGSRERREEIERVIEAILRDMGEMVQPLAA